MEPLVESTSTSWNFAALNISPTARSSLKQVYFTLCCALLSSGAGLMLNNQLSVGGLSTIISCMVCVAVLLTNPPSNEVYFTLCCVIVASTVGSYLHTLWNIGGLLTAPSCLGCMACLLSTPPSEEIKRLILLMATAAPEGTSIVPLVNLVIQIDYSILLTAFVGCAIAFGCFSVATMFAKRWEFLYLGALLSSGISILFWLQFASSIFGGGAFLFKFEFYFGVLVFVGCIVLIIMLNNSMEKNEKYKRD